MAAIALSLDDVGEIVAVLSDAFYDYPVMRYVLGPAEPYDQRLRRLVELFVSRHAYQDEPMVGVRDEAGALVAAATMTSPTPQDPPPALVALTDTVWAELGADAQARYDAFLAVAQQFAVESPHFYLDMIGVLRSHQGRGLGRVLLEAVHEISKADGRSSGVSLSTERAANVGFYEHLGYRVRGHARVGDEFETWTLFRGENPRSN